MPVRRSVLAALFFLVAPSGEADAQPLTDWIAASCEPCVERMDTETGAYLLEKGEEALVGRADASDRR